MHEIANISFNHLRRRALHRHVEHFLDQESRAILPYCFVAMCGQLPSDAGHINDRLAGVDPQHLELVVAHGHGDVRMRPYVWGQVGLTFDEWYDLNTRHVLLVEVQ